MTGLKYYATKTNAWYRISAKSTTGVGIPEMLNLNTNASTATTNPPQLPARPTANAVKKNEPWYRKQAGKRW